jgi:hypothetical protein
MKEQCRAYLGRHVTVAEDSGIPNYPILTTGRCVDVRRYTAVGHLLYIKLDKPTLTRFINASLDMIVASSEYLLVAR